MSLLPLSAQTAAPEDLNVMSFNLRYNEPKIPPSSRLKPARLSSTTIFVGPGVQVQTHGYYPTVKDGVFISDHWPVVSHVTIAGK